MRKRLLRVLRLAPLALWIASTAWAQTTGTIIGVVTDASTGKPVPGALIIARSPGLQGEQTAVTDDAGNYRLPQLPPGQYTVAVQIAGYRPAERSDIALRIDKTIRANLAVAPEAVQLQEQQVRTGVAPVINVGSAESGSVLTKEFLATVPVGRTFEAAAVAVPSAKADTYGVGFAGAQSPENNYILDGLNVTDPRYGTNGSQLLNNFVQEVDVKTGSFMPEFGRASGGVLNVVTKSGSNELHGSVFGNWQPGQLSPTGKVAGRAGEAIGFRSNPQSGAYNADFGLDLGGPIMKDRLWFYAGFAPVLKRNVYERFLRQNVLDGSGSPQLDSNGQFIQQTIPGTSRNTKTLQRAYQFNGKLTYLFDENNNFTLSGFGNPSSSTDIVPPGVAPTMNSSDSRRLFDSSASSYDLIGRYSGKFLQKRVILEAVGGWHRQSLTNEPTVRDGVDQGTTPQIRLRNRPRAVVGNTAGEFNITQFEDVPAGACAQDPGLQCTIDRYLLGGYGFNERLRMNRFSGRLAASYLAPLLGSHTFKGGLDYERNNYDQSKAVSGGGTYDFRGGGVANGFLMVRSYGVVNGDPNAPDAGQLFDRVGTKSVSNSTALFVQDSWQVANTGLTLNGGLRWEFQDMKDARRADSPKLSINDNIAPRVQAIYDFTRTGRSKIAANWGRFYESIPLDMGDRSFGSESQLNALFSRTTGCTLDPTAANFKALQKGFNPLTRGCNVVVGGNGVVTDNFGNAATWGSIGGLSPVAPDLKGMYVDQFGGSIEYEVFQDLSIGFEYAGRRLGRAIEDMSSNDGSTYFIANPGESKAWTFNGVVQDPRSVTTTDQFTNRTVTVGFPKPKRDYDGFTFKVGKNLSNSWLAQVSYTYSQLRGNYSGLFRPENDQIDPNITSEYDLPTLMQNKQGLLPGDVTHQVKLFGAYVWNFGPKLSATTGGGLTARSGTPVSALGAHPFYGAGEAWILQRGQAGRTPFVTNLDLSGSVEYRLSGPYAVQFKLDVFNVFNSQETLQIDENYTFDAVHPIIGAQCSSKNAVGKQDPIAAIQADCPDIKYLKTTDGRAVTVNPNFGRANPVLTAFQVPITFRFGLALTF